MLLEEIEDLFVQLGKVLVEAGEHGATAFFIVMADSYANGFEIKAVMPVVTAGGCNERSYATS